MLFGSADTRFQCVGKESFRITTLRSRSATDIFSRAITFWSHPAHVGAQSIVLEAGRARSPYWHTNGSQSRKTRCQDASRQRTYVTYYRGGWSGSCSGIYHTCNDISHLRKERQGWLASHPITRHRFHRRFVSLIVRDGLFWLDPEEQDALSHSGQAKTARGNPEHGHRSDQSGDGRFSIQLWTLERPFPARIAFPCHYTSIGLDRSGRLEQHLGRTHSDRCSGSAHHDVQATISILFWSISIIPKRGFARSRLGQCCQRTDYAVQDGQKEAARPGRSREETSPVGSVR